nr:hypothetical protein BaRGS_011722 [Batillaria attramentaria]
MVNSPQSRAQRVQLARMLRAHTTTTAVRPRHPRLNLQLDGLYDVAGDNSVEDVLKDIGGLEEIEGLGELRNVKLEDLSMEDKLRIAQLIEDVDMNSAVCDTDKDQMEHYPHRETSLARGETKEPSKGHSVTSKVKSYTISSTGLTSERHAEDCECYCTCWTTGLKTIICKRIKDDVEPRDCSVVLQRLDLDNSLTSEFVQQAETEKPKKKMKSPGDRELVEGSLGQDSGDLDSTLVDTGELMNDDADDFSSENRHVSTSGVEPSSEKEVGSVPTEVKIMCVLATESRLFAGLDCGAVLVVNPKTMQVTQRFQASDCTVQCMTWTREGSTRLLCVSDQNANILIIDAGSGLPVRNLIGHLRTSFALCVWKLADHKGIVTSVCVDNGLLFTAGYDKIIRCYDLKLEERFREVIRL